MCQTGALVACSRWLTQNSTLLLIIMLLAGAKDLIENLTSPIKLIQTNLYYQHTNDNRKSHSNKLTNKQVTLFSYTVMWSHLAT